MRRGVCLSGLVALAMLSAAASASSAPALEFRPNFNAVSVYLAGAGPESAPLEYRVKGSPDWLEAHDLVRNAAGMTCGSIIYLRAATRYQVRAQVNGSWVTGEVATRDDTFPAGGRVLTVGTERQLQDAVQAARPGDTVLVSPGTYRISLLVRATSGRPGAYIHIKSKVPGKAILDGSDPRFGAGRGGWRSEGEGVYSKQVEPAREVRSIWWNGRRVYQYYSRAEFDENKLAGKYPMNPVSSYWESRAYYDKPTHRLYVRLSDGANPDALGMQVPRFPHGVRLQHCHYLVLDGFTIRHFGAGHDERDSVGVDIDQSNNCVVRNCTIYGVNDGVRFHDWPRPGQEELYAHNTIEGNDIYQVGPAGVDWNLYKWNGLDSENAAIKPKEGRGVVIRNNTLHGFFNGIQPSTLGDGPDELLSYPWLGGADMDINNNLLYDIKDDGTECDGSCCNNRIWNNVFYGVWHGASNCPNGVGPSFLVRNLYFHRYRTIVPAYSFLKFSPGGARIDGRTYAYHNTVYNPHGAALEESNDSRFFTLRNNLLVSGNRYTVQWAQPIAGFDLDYDLLYHRGGDALAKVWTPQGLVRFDDLAALRKGLGWEEHGIEANPKFAGGDDPQEVKAFRLSADSPGRGKALSLGNFSAGWHGGKAAPDIGAFPYGREEPMGPAQAPQGQQGAP